MSEYTIINLFNPLDYLYPYPYSIKTQVGGA